MHTPTVSQGSVEHISCAVVTSYAPLDYNARGTRILYTRQLPMAQPTNINLVSLVRHFRHNCLISFLHIKIMGVVYEALLSLLKLFILEVFLIELVLVLGSMRTDSCLIPIKMKSEKGCCLHL